MVLGLVGCGPLPSAPARAEPAAVEPPPEEPSLVGTVDATTESFAFEQWERGVGGVAFHGCRVLRAGIAARPTELRRIVARALLAAERPAAALEWLGHDEDDDAIRLRVRAHELVEDWEAASALASRYEGVIGSAHTVHLAALAAAPAGSLWRASGATCARTPLEPSASAPVVHITVDGTEALALVAYDAPHSLVRTTLSATSHLATLGVGDVRVESVPLRPEDLAPWSTRARVPVDVVLGQDVLLRWGFGLVVGELWLHPSPQYRFTFDGGTTVWRIDGIRPAIDLGLSWRTGPGSTRGVWNLGVLLLEIGPAELGLSSLGRERIGSALGSEDLPPEEVYVEVDRLWSPLPPLDAVSDWAPPGGCTPACVGRISVPGEDVLYFRGVMQLGYITRLGGCTPDPGAWEVTERPRRRRDDCDDLE